MSQSMEVLKFAIGERGVVARSVPFRHLGLALRNKEAVIAAFVRCAERVRKGDFVMIIRSRIGIGGSTANEILEPSTTPAVVKTPIP